MAEKLISTKVANDNSSGRGIKDDDEIMVRELTHHGAMA